MPYLLFVLGLGMLTLGADRFVVGSTVIADRFGIPRLIIGMVLVGFATSAPEMMVSAMASFHGHSVLAVGNVIGSNIANIALVLGVAGLIRPLVCSRLLLLQEYPLLLMVTVVVFMMLYDRNLSRFDGFLLLGAFSLITYWMISRIRKQVPKREQDEITESIEESTQNTPFKQGLLWWCVGLVTLLIGAKLTLDSAIDIARLHGISELIIGLTIVALGTSLPELATAVVSTVRNEPEMVIGNVIGSNLFNTLLVLMMPALINPVHIPTLLLKRDFLYLIFVTVMLGAFTFGATRNLTIGRLKASIFLCVYVGFLVLLYLTTTHVIDLHY